MITPITRESVKKIQKHRYFDEHNSNLLVAENNKKLNSYIFNCIQKLMVGAYKHNNMESLIVVDIDTFAYRFNTNNLPTDVYLTPEMENAILNSGNTFIAMHNHPNNSTFSMADVLVLINYPNLQTIFMCTNDCNFIEVLDKGNRYYKFTVRVVIKILNSLVSKNIINKHSDAKYFIKYLKANGFKHDKYFNN